MKLVHLATDHGCVVLVQYTYLGTRKTVFIFHRSGPGSLALFVEGDDTSCPSIDSWPMTLLGFSDSFELGFFLNLDFISQKLKERCL